MAIRHFSGKTQQIDGAATYCFIQCKSEFRHLIPVE
jgi:hypothetical protein